MTQCFVSIGSNINKAKNIKSALNALCEMFGVLDISPICETPAVGFEGDDFYNLVVSFDSEFPAHAIFEKLREIEFAHGRELNSQKFSPRQLDLDLLLYGNAIVNDEKLKLPRSDIENYTFVLQPLANLAPDLIHPILKKSYGEMLQSHVLIESTLSHDDLMNF